jgi:hypothetical protein
MLSLRFNDDRVNNFKSRMYEAARQPGIVFLLISLLSASKPQTRVFHSPYTSSKDIYL